MLTLLGASNHNTSQLSNLAQRTSELSLSSAQTETTYTIADFVYAILKQTANTNPGEKLPSLFTDTVEQRNFAFFEPLLAHIQDNLHGLLRTVVQKVSDDDTGDICYENKHAFYAYLLTQLSTQHQMQSPLGFSLADRLRNAVIF